jgi:hypothetical protein
MRRWFERQNQALTAVAALWKPTARRLLASQPLGTSYFAIKVTSGAAPMCDHPQMI